MATKKKTTEESSASKAVTLEHRVERIEKGLLLLANKLRSHGIHLAPGAVTESEPEHEDGDEE